MGWQDDPVVGGAQPAWMKDPVVGGPQPSNEPPIAETGPPGDPNANAKPRAQAPDGPSAPFLSTVKDEFRQPLGLSKEASKDLAAYGRVMPYGNTIEPAIRAGAVVTDAAGRVVDLGMKGVAHGVALVGGDELGRDVYGMLQMAGLVAGAAGAVGDIPASVAPKLRDETAKSVEADAAPKVDPIEGLAKRLGGTDAHTAAAVQEIVKRVKQDIKGGGPTTQDMLDVLNATPQKPLVLADVAGENTVGLLGRISRLPGEAKQIVSKFLDQRDVGAGSRLAGNIKNVFGSDSAFHTADALVKARSEASAPLYKEAMKPGSVAPLEKQFESAFQDSSAARKAAAEAVAQEQRAVTQAEAGKSRAGANVYAQSAAEQKLRAAKQNLAEAQAKLQEAEANHAANLNQLRAAQQAVSSGERGGIYSPHIARMLQNTNIKRGILKGIQIEKNKADAANVPLNVSDYALKTDANGNPMLDEAGNPIVIRTPNMKLVQMAKEGLDAQIEDARDPVTGRIAWTKELLSIDELRRSLLNEVDRINPSYAAARESWAGPSSAMEALQWGQDVIRNGPRPEAIADRYARMSKNDREFAKLGAADELLTRIAKSGVDADEAKRIMGNDYTRQMLAPFFDKPSDMDNFVRSLQAETRMFNTRYKTLRNSLSATRLAEDASPAQDAAISGAKGAMHALTGSYQAAAKHIYSALEKLSTLNDPEINALIAKILTTPLTEGSDTIKAVTSAVDEAIKNPHPRAAKIADAIASVGKPKKPLSPNVLKSGGALAAGQGASTGQRQAVRDLGLQ